MMASRQVPTVANPRILPSTISPVCTGFVVTVWIARDLMSAGRLKTASTSVTRHTRRFVAARMKPT